jgi:glycosyltransferase involved in cell wall biosynthesis
MDSAYFLMFRGWESELQANRWHWAKHWAAVVPLVLVQPTQRRAPRSLESSPEPRLANSRILHVKSLGRRTREVDAELVAGQIGADLAANGHERPLLWCYNPLLRPAHAVLPAAARVYHATENYFQMDGIHDEFLGELRETIRLSDLTVAVSGGVARSLAAEVPGATIAEVSNGCDFAMYAEAVPDAGLRGVAKRVLVYAGNINSRLDFELLLRAAERRPADLFAFYGPVSGMERDDAALWRRLLRSPNVRHYGAVDPARLPGIYAAADLGLIPYKRTPLLVENGFPLKTLEMAATGLPVVSTRLDPIRGLARKIMVAADDGEFLASLGMSRETLTPEEAAELVEVARRNDYAAKFAHVRRLVDGVAHEPAPASPSLEATWRTRASPRYVVRVAAALDSVRLAFSALVVRLLPERIRERIPARLRNMLGRLLTPS